MIGVHSARFIMLGTGTSGGIPLIACDCPTCASPDPRDRRTRTAACVQWIDPAGRPRCVLIDAGPDLNQQARRHDLWRCDAILFTHNHVDHIFGLDEVRRFNAVMREPIDIYAEGYVLDSLRRVYKHVFDKDANVNDSFVATLIAHEITAPGEREGGPGATIDLWGMRFTPVRLLHGRLPIVGWRIEPADPAVPIPQGFPLAWCTDVSAIPPKSWPTLEGLSTLVLDALRHRHHPTHFNLDQAVDAALRLAADRTYFIHIAHEILHGAVEPELPESIHLGHDGLIIGSLGEAGERAFADDRARLSEGMRRREKAAARKSRFEEG